MTDPAAEVRKAIGESELLLGLQESSSLRGRGRPLSAAEIEALEKGRNWSPDWKLVRATDGFDPSRVRNSTLIGPVVLGRFEGEVALGGASLPPGVYNSTLSDCVVCDGALVKDVGVLARAVVREGAVVASCGEVSCPEACVFGNGSEMPVAIETGGREVLGYAELTIPVAEAVATRRSDKAMLAAYSEAIEAYLARARSDRMVVSEGAVVANTPKVTGVFVGREARIDGATLVEDSTVLSNAEEVTEIASGAVVSGAIVQWGCEVATCGIVRNSVMTEHSHVERHGKLTDSIVGPNTGVAEGEVTASLLGPFVGFHHQALLIAALWPEGKGNVSSGANVGSNHPSRAPDQEIWPGEGTFFGLGVHIKFPTDFSRAPYSIIAAGVTALPQKVTFPFSRIDVPMAYHEGLYRACNEITPGWVLSDNIYSVKRNEGKYKRRDKSRRSRFVFDVFRPYTVDLMLDARSRLQAAGGKEIYGDRDVEGLGKNFMTEGSRLKGIDAYTFYSRYYALTGLKRRLEAGADRRGILERASDGAWEHQRSILAAEFPGEEVGALLRRLVEAQDKVANDVLTSKQKDDVRGARVIDDYASAHGDAADDGFVVQSMEETRTLKAEVEALLAKLPR